MPYYNEKPSWSNVWVRYSNHACGSSLFEVIKRLFE